MELHNGMVAPCSATSLAHHVAGSAGPCPRVSASTFVAPRRALTAVSAPSTSPAVPSSPPAPSPTWSVQAFCVDLRIPPLWTSARRPGSLSEGLKLGNWPQIFNTDSIVSSFRVFPEALFGLAQFLFEIHPLVLQLTGQKTAVLQLYRADLLIGFLLNPTPGETKLGKHTLSCAA